MSKGRKPKPRALKELAGNPGKRPLPENEPRPQPRIPDCPAHLQGEGKAEWERVTPLLLRLGILTTIDRAALTAYCQLWERWVDAEQNIRKLGVIVRQPTGYPIQNPYLAIANTAMEGMRKFLVEFGMTPSSRSKVHAEASDKNPNLYAASDEEDFFDQAPDARKVN